MDNRNLAALALAFSTLAVVAVGLTGKTLNTFDIFHPSLYLASSVFLLLSVVRGAWQTWPGRFLFLGLVGCWFGDILGPSHFYRGATAFALGHIGFAAAFAVRGVIWRRFAWVVVIVGAVQALMLTWLLQYVPADEAAFSIFYTAVIATMMSLALSQHLDLPGARLLMAAAIVFYISDLFVARWRFVSPGPENALLCYPLYYTACVMFAWAAGAMEKARANLPEAVPSRQKA